MQWRALVLAVGCAGALVAGAGDASAAPPASPRSTPGEAGEVRHTVTLVTGDIVYLERQPGGRQAATIKPGPGRERIDFLQHEVDGRLLVIPADVVPQLRDKRLDRALFDITGLVEQGYADEQASALPLILSYGPDVDLRAAAAPMAAEVGATLTSLRGLGVRADKRRATEFWRSMSDTGVERISLDRKVRASLDRSVPQIGAPEAWAAGYDGRGTTVAVLDTGYDATHPDISAKVTRAANFTPSADTVDRFGHGTHVAATIAGNGARKGVAPGADLIVGKVLDDDGIGYDSWILAGMEWAAAQGAKVVNLSLGGGATDGTDPLSLGLNEISARTGTLFVVAAGNSGADGPNSVSTPGVADEALTVGAVDRNEVLAPFSSRGPRYGRPAVKPDITAPGVNIVAARAAGTSMGRPVDDRYTEASGTSMATPHVAGAAAILAQRYPQWTGRQLKDALASTSRPAADLTVFEQGGGRVDVPRSVAQGVYATGTLNLDAVYDGVAGKSSSVRGEVGYTNTTTAPVTLNLALTMRGFNGTPAGDGITVEQSTVDIAPGATATVGILADGPKLRTGTYGGVLTATAIGVLVHTAVGAVKEAPRHRVTFTAIDILGRPTFASPVLLYGDDYRFDALGYVAPGGQWVAEVAEGTYYLNGLVAGNEAQSEAATYQVIDPAVRIAGDTRLVLDARKATEVVIETRRPAEQRSIFSFYVHREVAGRRISNYVMKFADTRKLLVTPTPRVTEGTLEFGSRWSLTAPLLTTRTLPSSGPIELKYLDTSPKLDGWRILPVVWAGAGRPADYQGRTVRGRIALVEPPEAEYDPTVQAANAAAAGAAMVLVISPKGWFTAARATNDDELPIITLGVSYEQGTALAELDKRRPVHMSLYGIPDSPYLYDVMHVERDRVPDRVVYRVSDRNSATVSTAYHEMGGDDLLKEQRFGWRPWQQTAINQYQRVVGSPRVREEIITADDTTWQHRVRHYFSWENLNPLAGGLTQAPRRYRPGECLRDDWYAPVIRPAIPRDVPGIESVRAGDALRFRIPEFGDGAGHYGFTEGEIGSEPDVSSAKLYRDGQLVAEAPDAWRDFVVSPDPAAYRLDLSVQRGTPNWRFSTRTDTSWTFRSRRGDARLPLLQVDYRMPTDLTNLVAANRRVTINLTTRHQTGPVSAKLRAWVSYDDGTTWSEVEVSRRGQAVVDHPRLDRTNGFVALRVQATDHAGNSVNQTVLRAYGLNRH